MMRVSINMVLFTTTRFSSVLSYEDLLISSSINMFFSYNASHLAEAAGQYRD